MFIRCLILSLIAVSLSACKIYGTAEKGPFRAGSEVTATQLDAQANPINTATRSTTVENDQGEYLVTRIDWDGFTEVSVSGSYFNEFLGVESNATITLNAISDKDLILDTVNTHLFTTLAASRIRQLVTNGQTIADAWSATQIEIANVFGLTNLDVNGVEQLDLLDGTSANAENNAILLLFSGGFLDIDGDTNTINTLSADFADNGAFDGVALNIFNSIAVSAGQDGLLNILSANLIANGATSPPDSADLPTLPQWIIEITPQNEAPIADAQSITVNEDSTNNSISLTATDADTDPLSFSIVDQPTNGTITINEAEVSYTPNPDFFGNDSFTFLANDGTDDSSTATISITVNEIVETVNPNAPIIESRTVLVFQNSIDNEISPEATDPLDDRDRFTTIIKQPENGTLFFFEPNLLAYTPVNGFIGEDSFVIISTNSAGDSLPATVFINVVEIPTLPETITITGTAISPIFFFDTTFEVFINNILVETVVTDADTFDGFFSFDINTTGANQGDIISINVTADADAPVGSPTRSVRFLSSELTEYDFGVINLTIAGFLQQ